MTNARLALLTAVVSTFLLSTRLAGQTAPVPGQLPTPSGAFTVGRVAYDWTDSSRREVHASDSTSRRLIVHVWYPAQPTPSQTRRATYIENFPAVQKVLPRTALESLFRPAPYSLIEQSGLPATHAVERADIAASPAKFPIIVFSHGLGMLNSIYTAEIEDLVSHGYVVAAINHTYDAAFTVFSDGGLVTYARDAWNTESAKPNGYVSYVRTRLNDFWVPDIQFVIDQLARHDSTLSLGAPFAGRLDLQRIGALGHSMGGLAVVRACERDTRIRACINQDADIAGSPFIETPAESLRQPLLFFTAATSNVFRDSFVRPSDEELARMKTTRVQYDQDVARVQKNQNDAMSRVSGGSYRALIDISTFIHRTFSDLTLLEAHYDASKTDHATRNFRIAQSYTLAFFDKYLKGTASTLLDGASPYPGVRVDRFASR